MRSWQHNPLHATPRGVIGKHNRATLSPSEGFLMCLEHASPLRSHPETCPSGLTRGTHSCPPCSPHPTPPGSSRTRLPAVPKLHCFKHTSSGSPPVQRTLQQPVPQWSPAVGFHIMRRPCLQHAVSTQLLCGLQLCLKVDVVTIPSHSGDGALAPRALTRPPSLLAHSAREQHPPAPCCRSA